MVRTEKLNMLKEYFKVGIKRLSENPESAFEKSVNVQESIFNSMPEESHELLKEVSTQFGNEVINEVMTSCMTELLVEDPVAMANLLKNVVDYTVKLELESREKEKCLVEFRDLVKEVSGKIGKLGSQIVFDLDYCEDVVYRIEQLKKMLISEN